MNISEVIKFPILSEKTYAQMAEKVYTFAVDPRTNRSEVKKAIEFIFEVKVKKVNIISIDKMPTQLGRSKGFTNRIKKAIVTLSEGQINIFPEEVENTSTKEEVKEENKIQQKATSNTMSEAEKKAAAKIAAKTKAKIAEKEKENVVSQAKSDEPKKATSTDKKD